MLGDNAPVLADYDTIRIGMNPDRTGHHRILLLSKRSRQVFETDAGTAELRVVMRLSVGGTLIEQPSVQVLNHSRGVKTRSRASLTWFSTWPFSQPDAGVQAPASTLILDRS